MSLRCASHTDFVSVNPNFLDLSFIAFSRLGVEMTLSQQCSYLPFFAIVGCGSWNADKIVTHPFDRGAFGFQRVHCGTCHYLLCLWPIYGGVVGRHRCQCNGPLWNRMLTDCGTYIHPHGLETVLVSYPSPFTFPCA